MADTVRISAKKQLLFLIVAAGIAFVLLLIFQREILQDTWETLLDARIELVLLLPLLQVLNYFLIGQYYRKGFKLFGAKIGILRSWGVVAAMNFVNQVLPSGGISGITYLAYGFRTSVETGKTTLVQIGRYMSAFLGYAILMPVAFLLVTRGGKTEEFNGLVDTASNSTAAIFVLIIFVALMGTATYSFFNRRLSHVLGQFVLRFANWFNRAVLRRHNQVELKFLRQLNNEFHQGTEVIRKKGFRALLPSLWMLMSALVEVLIVFVSLAAVGGAEVGVGPVFLAFVAANIVGVVSVIPGDVGVHEATVILVLVAFGVDEPVAISTTLLYRVFNKVIFLPIGFYFYANILRPAIEGKQVTD